MLEACENRFVVALALAACLRVESCRSKNLYAKQGAYREKNIFYLCVAIHEKARRDAIWHSPVIGKEICDVCGHRFDLDMAHVRLE